MVSTGRHSNGTVRTSRAFAALMIGGASAAVGVVLAVVALVELFRYSPYEDPGAGTAGLWLGLAALVLTGIPGAVMAIAIIRTLLRHYTAWKRSLTPGQRLAVTFAEVLGLEAAHIAWRDHNRKESARLTASVMGEKRDAR